MIGCARRPPVAIFVKGCWGQIAEARPAILSEGISNAEFQVRAALHSDFQLEEQTAALFGANDEIEAAFSIGTSIVGVVPVDGGSAADVQVPCVSAGECVREIEVAGDQRGVVAEADVDARTKPEPIDQRTGFDVTAEIELIGV